MLIKKWWYTFLLSLLSFYQGYYLLVTKDEEINVGNILGEIVLYLRSEFGPIGSSLMMFFIGLLLLFFSLREHKNEKKS